MSTKVTEPGSGTLTEHLGDGAYATITPPRREKLSASSSNLIAWLRENYAVFLAHAPLKLGIHIDIRARHPEIDTAVLRIALRRHAKHSKYLRQCAADGAVRLDLDGESCGEVIEEHRRAAQEWLAARVHSSREARLAKKARAKAAGQKNVAPAATEEPLSPAAAPAGKTVGRGGRPIIRIKKSRRGVSGGGNFLTRKKIL